MQFVQNVRGCCFVTLTCKDLKYHYVVGAILDTRQPMLYTCVSLLKGKDMFHTETNLCKL